MENKILGCLSLAAVFSITACSGMHSEQYKSNKSANIEAFKAVEKETQSSVVSIGAGAIVDDFFIDTTPFTVPLDRSADLPRHLPSDITFISSVHFSENHLKNVLFSDYGLRIDFVRLIGRNDDDADGSVDELSLDTPDAGFFEGDDQPDLGSDSSSSSDSLSAVNKQALALFTGASVVGSDGEIPPLDFTGKLVDFVDLIANETGLSWRYDSVDDMFVFYDLDTKIFTVIDNTAEYKSSVNISTASSSLSGDDSGSTGASTNQEVGYGESGNHWESLEITINEILSADGVATFDQKNGYITVTDKRSSLTRVGQVVDTLNEADGTLVFLDVSYIKVNLDQSSEFGVTLSADGFMSKLFDGVTGGYAGASSLNSVSSVLTTNFTKSGLGAIIGAMGSYGTVSNRIDLPMVTMNNTPQPYQAVVEESYISKLNRTTDDTGAVTVAPETEVNKTGVTSIFTPRVFDDKVIVRGRISVSDNLKMDDLADLGIMLPKNASETHLINTIIPNGKSRIASVQLIEKSSTSGSGPVGDDSFLLGGQEVSVMTREIAMVVVTPYIIK